MNDKRRRLRDLQKAIRVLAAKASKGTLTRQEQLQLVSMDADIKKIECLIKCERDVQLFAYEYFSDEHNPDNQAGNIITNDDDGTPHESYDEVSVIHQDFYAMCNEINAKRKGNYAVASPRGHSKSSIFSVIFVIHQLVYRKRPYIIVLSETDSLSKKLIMSIANQLKHNERLRADFGELLHPQSTKNIRDNEESFITLENVLVEASSTGKPLRGKNHLSNRPGLVVCDDLSSQANENTEDARDKLIHWFNSVLMPMPAKDAAIVVVGTVVSQNGLLSTLLKRRDFKRLFHSAIISYPTNPQLWDDYLHLYQTAETEQEYESFYETNYEAMNEGVTLAWPRRWTYKALMETKNNIGGRAFASEFLNESFSEDEQLFNVDSYAYGRMTFEGSRRAIHYNDKYYYLSDMTITGAWDTALAQSARSCMNAFVTVGRHNDSKLLFVIDVYSAREVPSVFMERIVERVHDYGHKKITVEGVGAYSLLHEQLLDRLRHERLYSVKVDLLKSHGKLSKTTRIESLEPMLANKSLILQQRHEQLMTELRQYPQGLVDTLDALQIAVQAGNERVARIIPKPDWMYGPPISPTDRGRSGRIVGRRVY